MPEPIDLKRARGERADRHRLVRKGRSESLEAPKAWIAFVNLRAIDDKYCS
jgi:hypothetical protein